MREAAKYSASLEKAIPPELRRRLEIVAERRRVSIAAVINDFLARGANTPQFLGAGVNT